MALAASSPFPALFCWYDSLRSIEHRVRRVPHTYTLKAPLPIHTYTLKAPLPRGV